MIDTHSLILIRSPKDGKGLELRRLISLDTELTSLATRFSSSMASTLAYLGDARGHCHLVNTKSAQVIAMH